MEQIRAAAAADVAAMAALADHGHRLLRRFNPAANAIRRALARIRERPAYERPCQRTFPPWCSGLVIGAGTTVRSDK